MGKIKQYIEFGLMVLWLSPLLIGLTFVHLLQRPRAFVKWLQQGCGRPSPIQIERQEARE